MGYPNKEDLSCLEEIKKFMYEETQMCYFIVWSRFLRQKHQVALFKKEFISLWDSDDETDKLFLEMFRRELYNGYMPEISFDFLPKHLYAYTQIIRSISDKERQDLGL